MKNQFPDGSVLLGGQSFSGLTGTMAAALGANSTVGVVRYPSAATNKRFGLTWMHLHYVCIVAFTAPVTAGRRLALFRGAGADATGGNALDVVPNVSSEAVEEPLVGRIADTAGLTTTGITFESSPKARLLLAHAGASGNDYDEIWSWDDPFVLLPGELAGLRNPAAFDAGGTWQLSWKGGGREL